MFSDFKTFQSSENFISFIFDLKIKKKNIIKHKTQIIIILSPFTVGFNELLPFFYINIF